ncbi:hypothetical protein FRX31_003405 [Thalictrum thalictroides]|uniref:Peptidase A1 domain-containing protein n=1 Tax=Thalictrum thalictroides TaxID=46969 RepID=A0A7J6XF62_THATH|nr:hypothetical protein FRX31_003405 [Thalictrum thalictroides]
MTSVTAAFTILLLILLQFSSAPASFLSSPEPRNTPTEFSARLINRNSVNSPFYNPKLAHYDRVKAAVNISIARQKYFQSKRFRLNDMMNPPVKSSDYEYITTKFSIGSPPVETFAVVDTASSLSWLQCRRPKPVFDPAKSQSRKVPCKGVTIQIFKMNYPGVGVFGLNRGQLSIISQAGYGGFSYCLAPKDKPPEAESSLHFHVNNNITGNSTPMLIKPNWDLLNMVSISLGDTRLVIPPENFKDGLVIDSSVPFTMLEHYALATLQFEIGRWLGGQVSDPMHKFNLCYLTTDYQIARLPDLTFHCTVVVTSAMLQLFFKTIFDPAFLHSTRGQSREVIGAVHSSGKNTQNDNAKGIMLHR